MSKNIKVEVAPQGASIESKVDAVIVKNNEVANTTTGADALKGRISSRTHAMHVVLIEAYKTGAMLSTKQIVAKTRELLGAEHLSYAKLDRTAPSHLNTMKTRQYVERALDVTDGATKWRLTQLGASLANVEAPNANSAPAKTKKTRTKKDAK